MKALKFIKDYLPYLLIAAMGFGLWNGVYNPMAFSRIICVSALLVMIYPVMINLRIEEGLKIKGSGKAIIYSLLLNFVFSPIVAITLSYLFFKGNPYAAIGFYLIGLIPTSGMTINWIHNTKTDMHTGIVLVTTNVLAAVAIVPVVLPLLVKYVLNAGNLAVDPLIILEKLSFVVVLPLFLGWVTRLIGDRTIGKKKLADLQPLFGGISRIGLLLVMFLVMSLSSSQVILQNIQQSLFMLIPMFIYYLIMLFSVLYVVQKAFNKKQGLPVLFSSFLRYHVISLGIALAAFGEDQNGFWVLLPIITALLIQPTFTSFLAHGYLKKLKFEK